MVEIIIKRENIYIFRIMVELTLEDRLGPINIGRDYGIGNLVEGGVYASLLVASGVASTRSFHDLAGIVESNFGAYSTGVLFTGAIPFFTFAIGVGHSLGEPGSNEKIITGLGLAGMMMYSLSRTLDTAYHGLSLSSYLMQAVAGNYTFGLTVAYQALLPILAVFGAGYVVGKLARWISGRSGRVTRRRTKRR